jgi:penicillin-binding protein 1A
MLQDVVRHGTGIRAMQLGRQDLAGKTGTTNDSIDAWFCGFQPTVVGIAWMGYDQPRSLGDRETGGGAALPIWMSYMGTVLKGVPEATYTMPDGMVEVHIDADGYRDDNSPLTDIFYKENVPPERASPPPSQENRPADTVRDQLL